LPVAVPLSLPVSWPGPAPAGGLAGIQPAKANREAFAAEQRGQFV
jgi:hypothetical protein